MRAALLGLCALAALVTAAGAQFSVPGVTDSVNPFPVFGVPLDEGHNALMLTGSSRSTS